MTNNQPKLYKPNKINNQPKIIQNIWLNEEQSDMIKFASNFESDPAR